MRFTITKSSLDKALSIVMKGISNNTTLPHLLGVYMGVENGTLELRTTNLSISIKHHVQVNSEENGACLFPGKLLSNIIKNLPDYPVLFYNEGNKVFVECEDKTFSINTLNAEDFPSFPSIETTSSVELPIETLSSMVDKVYKISSRDSTNAILSGICITVEENIVRLMAADSFRFSICDTSCATENLTETFTAIIPATSFHDALSIPVKTSSVFIGCSDSQVVFEFGQTSFISRRLEGNFPKCEKVLPQSVKTQMKVNVGNFISALRSVNIFSSSLLNVKLNYDVEDGSILITSEDKSQGTASAISTSLEAQGYTDFITLGYEYIMDCLNSFNEKDELFIEFNGQKQPIVFKNYGSVNYLYFLMPVLPQNR